MECYRLPAQTGPSQQMSNDSIRAQQRPLSPSHAVTQGQFWRDSHVKNEKSIGGICWQTNAASTPAVKARDLLLAASRNYLILLFGSFGNG